MIHIHTIRPIQHIIFIKTESFVLQKLREGVGYQMPGHTRLGVMGKAGLQEPDAGRWGEILFDYSITKKQKNSVGDKQDLSLTENYSGRFLMSIASQ